MYASFCEGEWPFDIIYQRPTCRVDSIFLLHLPVSQVPKMLFQKSYFTLRFTLAFRKTARRITSTVNNRNYKFRNRFSNKSSTFDEHFQLCSCKNQ